MRVRVLRGHHKKSQAGGQSVCRLQTKLGRKSMGAGVYTLERKMGGCQRMAGRERVGERARKRYRVAEMHRIP